MLNQVCKKRNIIGDGNDDNNKILGTLSAIEKIKETTTCANRLSFEKTADITEKRSIQKKQL